MAAVATLDRVSFGDRLRAWRIRRRLSQLQLANEAGVSARHLSFLETGRSRPSRELVLHLAEHLEVPLRDRNVLLEAAGFAPTYRETSLDEPSMSPVRSALRSLLRAHDPYPALVVDRNWDLVDANRGTLVLVQGVAPELLEPPINVVRITLHPDGLARRIVNFDMWCDHMLTRLARDVRITGNQQVAALYDEARTYIGNRRHDPDGDAPMDVVIPMRLRTDEGELTLFSTIAVFGTPVDITLDELAIETFYPADAFTEQVLRKLVPGTETTSS